MEIIRYTIQDKQLGSLVKFFWDFQNSGEMISQKLLPTESIDILINLGDPMVYTIDSKAIIAPKIHINGLRRHYSFIQQSGNVHVVGISLYAYGLFPFMQKSMSLIKDRIVNLHSFSSDFAQGLELATLNSDYIKKLEQFLVAALPEEDLYLNNINQLRLFINADAPITVRAFCDQNNVNIKTFERQCIRYTGYAPTTLRRIQRFQSASNQIVHQSPDNLADVAYSNDYADQAHLNREFKSFSGEAPRSFTKQKSSVKENVAYRYL